MVLDRSLFLCFTYMATSQLSDIERCKPFPSINILDATSEGAHDQLFTIELCCHIILKDLLLFTFVHAMAPSFYRSWWCQSQQKGYFLLDNTISQSFIYSLVCPEGNIEILIFKNWSVIFWHPWSVVPLPSLVIALHHILRKSPVPFFQNSAIDEHLPK